jgi:hypothetical protein
MEAVMPLYKGVYKDMQKKTNQSKDNVFFTSKFSISPSAMHPTLFDHPDNFQPGTLMSFLQT